MVNNKTLIVVGAGAGKEIGMPAGAELKNQISQLLNIRLDYSERHTGGDKEIFDAFHLATSQSGMPSNSINDYLVNSWRICAAMPQAISIDNFIDNHRNNKLIEIAGKLAIVRSILKAEKSSHLYFDRDRAKSTINYQAVENTWYNLFMQLLTENCPIEELADRLSKIVFIIFNYDRCVEHFICNAIENYYGVDRKVASKLVNEIEIYHPYGSIGGLSWQNKEKTIDFGSDIHPRTLLELSSQIKTFAEGTDSKKSAIDDIRQTLLEARIVIFLGFAFHRQNMELLKPERRAHSGSADNEYYATAFGYSESGAESIERDIGGLLEVGAKKLFVRRDLKCNELLREYWRDLALSFNY